jgi:hypothetical protein
MLLWARDHKFVLSGISVDGVDVTVGADLGTVPSNISMPNPRSETNLIDEFGSRVLERLRRDSGDTSVIDEPE